MDHGGEACVGLVVPCCDAAEFFEIAEEVLDLVAPLVHGEVAGNVARPIGLGRDHGGRPSGVQFRAQPIVVEGLVGQEGAELDVRDQRCDADAVVALARQQQEAGEIAQGIDQRHDLGGQTAARPADGLILSPPFAPLPC